MKPNGDPSNSASEANGERSIGLTRKLVARIKRRLAAGETAYAVAHDLGVGYMAVYKIGTGETWKDVEPRGRLIKAREPGLTPAHRDWAWKKKRKGWSARKIARKLDVSETTAGRLLREAHLLMSARVHQMFLTSGTHEAAIRAFRLTPAEVEGMIETATSTALPPKLRKELSND